MPTFTMPNVHDAQLHANSRPTGLDFSKLDLSKLDLSKLDLSKFDLSKFNVSKIDCPKVDLPKVDLPGVDVDRLGDLRPRRRLRRCRTRRPDGREDRRARRGLQAEATTRARQLADAIA